MENSKRFRKVERLCSQKEIDALFESGQSFHIYPFRVLWNHSAIPEKYPVKIAISVPKRRFKRAVARNLIRRRIREAYRSQKAPFYTSLEDKQISISAMLIYTSDKILSYQEIDHKISLMIKRFQRELEQ